MAQGGEEGRGRPAAMRNLGMETLAARAHPRSGAIFVLVQVSSMKTRREGRSGSDRPSTAGGVAPSRDDLARWRSASFCVTPLLGVNEQPDRAIADLQAALSQFGDQSTKGEVVAPAALQQPILVRALHLLRPMTSHLAGRQAARLAESIDPIDHRADGNAEPGRRLPV